MEELPEAGGPAQGDGGGKFIWIAAAVAIVLIILALGMVALSVVKNQQAGKALEQERALKAVHWDK